MQEQRGLRGRKAISSFLFRSGFVALGVGLRSGCVGILRNNRLRLFASFRNNLNSKTYTVSVYLSNIHPFNNSAKDG